MNTINPSQIPVQKSSTQKPNPQTPAERKLWKACNDFEQIMIKQMLSVMQSDTKMFGEGFGGSFFQGVFQDEIAKKMVGNGFGLADSMYKQMTQYSNNSNHSGTTQNKIDTKK